MTISEPVSVRSTSVKHAEDDVGLGASEITCSDEMHELLQRLQRAGSASAITSPT